MEENNDVEIAVYPNPTSGEFTVKYEGLNHIRIVNPLGQIVYDTDVDCDQVHVDLSCMIKGVYIIQIEANNNMAIQKIIVK